MHQRMFAVGLALALGCATPIAIDSVRQGQAAQAQRQADDQSADQLQLARELPSSPAEVVQAFVDLLAEDAAQDGCLLFSSPAAAQFAVAHHVPNCVAAMEQLHDMITDPAAYIDDVTVPDTALNETGSTATLNGCALSWSEPFSDTTSPNPGPPLGFWALTQLDGEGWQITRYQPC